MFERAKRVRTGFGRPSRAGIAALALVAGAAWAQPEGGLAARFEGLIARMDDPSWREREGALQELLDLAWVDLRAVEPLLDDPSLSPEQHLRLERVALEMFLRGSRAGMGIQFGTEVPAGVPISATVQGFDAHRVLEAGDVVLRVDGHEMTSRRDLQIAIIASDPGDRLELTLIRDGGVRTVSVELGSFEALGSAGALDRGLLRAAWRYRRDTAREQPRPLLAIELGGWEQRLAQAPASPAPSRVAAGGAARGGLDDEGNIRIRVGGRDFTLPASVALGRGLRLGSEFEQVEALLDDLDQRRRTIQGQIARNNAALQRADLSEAERRGMVDENTRLREELGSVTLTLQQMRFVADELLRQESRRFRP